MNNLVTNNTETTANLDQNVLLSFLDHTVLQISQAHSAEEVDLLMDDFLSHDVINIFRNNSEMFSLLNAVWLNTFKRIFIEQRSDSFPLKVLWLPLLFNDFGWEIEDIETFESANMCFQSQHLDQSDLYKHLVELFMNGLKFNPQVSFNLFKKRLDNLKLSNSDQTKVKTLIQEIEELGW